ncbi:MAG: hypothetical protein ABIH23_35110 [bacterium]
MKHEFGIKARHMSALEEQQLQRPDSENKPQYAFAVFSDKPGRIIQFLGPRLAKRGKYFQFYGFDLYREGIRFGHTPEGQRVVALVLADGPEDRIQRSDQGVALWKETIIHFSKSYFEQFIEEIFEDHLPATLTIVLLFSEKAGRLTQDDLKELEKEMTKSGQEGPALDVRECQNEEEVAGVLEKNVLERVLAKHSLQSKLKERKKTRQQRIAKATKVTKEATNRP